MVKYWIIFCWIYLG